MLWINVTSRLPETTEPCLVLCGTDYRGGPLCVVAEHEGENSWSRDNGDTLELPVSHWMPLPSSAAREDVLVRLGLETVNRLTDECDELRVMLRRVYETCRLNEDCSIRGDIKRLLDKFTPWTPLFLN